MRTAKKEIASNPKRAWFKIIKSALIAIVIFGFPLFALPVIGSTEDFDINSDLEMDSRFDWVIDVKVFDTAFLNYPESKLKPVTKLLVSYRMNPRFGDTCGKVIKYEELWYNLQQEIGCRRLHSLDLPDSYQGAIRIIPSESASKNSDAISGAIVRLLLDICLQKCLLSAIYVPIDIFERVDNNLSRYNFTCGNQMPAGAQSAIVLHMYSNPLYTNPISMADNLYFCQK